MLLWAGVVEDAIALIPNGMTVQQYMPFLNGIYGTGQWLALTPPWGRSGALELLRIAVGRLPGRRNRRSRRASSIDGLRRHGHRSHAENRLSWRVRDARSSQTHEGKDPR